MVTVELKFNVVGVETAVDLTLNDIDTLVNVTFENFILAPQISSLDLKSVSTLSSTVGRVNALELKTVFNIAMSLAIPTFNKILSTGYEIPHTFVNGLVAISEATFYPHNDYISISFVPQFF